MVPRRTVAAELSRSGIPHRCFSCWFRSTLTLFYGFQNELENFPIGSIQHCQAVMNSCSYDSILALVCKESGQNKADLHLFQCDDIKVEKTHTGLPEPRQYAAAPFGLRRSKTARFF